MRGRLRTLLAVFAASLGLTDPALSDPVTLEGITFSDAAGGFEIVDGWGSGTIDDPFTLVERVTGSGDAVLVVEGMTREFGNRAGSNHFSGFVLVKIVHNATTQTWRQYRIELQENPGDGSTYYDGLSFGQEQGREARSIISDRYASVRVVDEPADGLLFTNGAVAPGDTVTFTLLVTDNSPVDLFYVVQRREVPLSMLVLE